MIGVLKLLATLWNIYYANEIKHRKIKQIYEINNYSNHVYS